MPYLFLFTWQWRLLQIPGTTRRTLEAQGKMLYPIGARTTLSIEGTGRPSILASGSDDAWWSDQRDQYTQAIQLLLANHPLRTRGENPRRIPWSKRPIIAISIQERLDFIVTPTRDGVDGSGLLRTAKADSFGAIGWKTRSLGTLVQPSPACKRRMLSFNRKVHPQSVCLGSNGQAWPSRSHSGTEEQTHPKISAADRASLISQV